MEIELRFKDGKRITILKGNIFKSDKGIFYRKRQWDKYKFYKIGVFSVEIYKK